MGALLTYSYNESKELVHIDSVERGAACKCRCPYCDAPLYAKNGGMVREHHFAHTQNHTCEGAYETTLHLLAKEIIKEQGGIMLPYSGDIKRPNGFVKLHNIEIEKWDKEYNFRPDLEGVMDDGRRLLIECLVTHKVDENKRNIIVSNNLLCIEIDLSWQIRDKNILRKFLTQEIKERKWIVKENPILKYHRQEDSSSCESFAYKRNPRFSKARDIMIKAFNDGCFTFSSPYLTKDYELHKLGYDECRPNLKSQGFKADLLLLRNKYKDPGFIAICFRGRRRNFNSYLPNIRIIDIIIREESDEELTNRFSKGINDYRNIEFVGNKWKFYNQ